MSTELADQVGHVPENFDNSNRSTACLLQDAGFPELRGAVNVDEIEAVLRDDPSLVDLWFERNVDQRLAGGWGIEEEDGGYRIQNYAGGESLRIADRARACAEFIMRYVRFIGDVQSRTR